jgi:hypothetical protein
MSETWSRKTPPTNARTIVGKLLDHQKKESTGKNSTTLSLGLKGSTIIVPKQQQQQQQQILNLSSTSSALLKRSRSNSPQTAQQPSSSPLFYYERLKSPSSLKSQTSWVKQTQDGIGEALYGRSLPDGAVRPSVISQLVHGWIDATESGYHANSMLDYLQYEQIKRKEAEVKQREIEEERRKRQREEEIEISRMMHEQQQKRSLFSGSPSAVIIARDDEDDSAIIGALSPIRQSDGETVTSIIDRKFLPAAKNSLLGMNFECEYQDENGNICLIQGNGKGYKFFEQQESTSSSLPPLGNKNQLKKKKLVNANETASQISSSVTGGDKQSSIFQVNDRGSTKLSSLISSQRRLAKERREIEKKMEEERKLKMRERM